MKKQILFILLLLLPLVSMGQQSSFEKTFQQGLKLENKALYHEAIKIYSAAIILASNKTEKEKVAYQINVCAGKLEQTLVDDKRQKEIVEEQKRKAKIAEEVALEALLKADLMQQKFETAMFDKAVKAHFPEWKGFDKYESLESKKNNILQRIDSLDLSNNALLRIPKEVGSLTNLTYLDLSRNDLTEFLPEIGKLPNLS